MAGAAARPSRPPAGVALGGVACGLVGLGALGLRAVDLLASTPCTWLTAR